MGQIISRILDAVERWLPKPVVQTIIGLLFWMGAVWVLASGRGSYSIIGASLMAVAGGLPIVVATRDVLGRLRENKCPIGEEWVSRQWAIGWLTTSSGMFSSGALQVPAARNLASGVIYDLGSKYRKSVRCDGAEVNLEALKWYSARMLRKGSCGTIDDGVVRWSEKP